jgi:hypothetical protein
VHREIIVTGEQACWQGIVQCMLVSAELYANSTVEDQKVRDIMEMGFSRDRALKALARCGMDKQAAIEHILSSS